jgi:hypothetical protein
MSSRGSANLATKGKTAIIVPGKAAFFLKYSFSDLKVAKLMTEHFMGNPTKLGEVLSFV